MRLITFKPEIIGENPSERGVVLDDENPVLHL
jgi:hypothetical protein